MVATAYRFNDTASRVRRFLAATHGAIYLAAKERDFAGFVRGTLLTTALFVLAAVGWDFAIDPVHAWQLIWLRFLGSALVLLWALASWRNVHAPMARALAVLVPLAIEASFIHVLAVLNGGGAYGMGGFLYFFILVPFLTLAQPLVLSAAVLVLLAVMPPVASLFGLSADLDWVVYTAYIGLALGPVMLILLMFEYLYWTVFRYRRKVEVQAVTDALTAVANRRHFMLEAAARLENRQQCGAPASLLFVDIDRFKAINDRHGHALGDQALTHVVNRLKQVLRDDDLIARYGGEEFVVLLSDADTDHAVRVAERMRVAVKTEPYDVAGTNEPAITLTVSIGIATRAADRPVDLDTLIIAADRALYDAKSAGRDRVVAAAERTEAGRHKTSGRSSDTAVAKRGIGGPRPARLNLPGA
ncbi:GGDEF domain-containing protein [Salinisphaera sp.]|uniref:GGDEF domain-containing protein n=1 Tax=Salinisphaera sp. TaxID=1914330 RepID=UPI002D78810F|nr:GGDEF domain-containing protein [Salinisphaera sp.]HET7313065.1 GGDEF domain-containing protein [Salinisphaera sp.]